MRFPDRRQAGQRLGERLRDLAGERPVVLALPRGGVPVAHEVARALGAPLDVLIVRKVGAPFQPELGVGAVAEGGALFIDQAMCEELGITDEEIETVVARERAEIERRVRRYRPGRDLIPITGRTVILVDDGVATGGTARAAVQALRALAPRRIVFATPVSAIEAAGRLRRVADEVVTLLEPETMWAIGEWYGDFRQVDDREVVSLLERAAERVERGEGDMSGEERMVQLVAGDAVLDGTLVVPPGATGLVVFAHGSGSSRFSPRNRYVAAVLQARGLATLLVDLLTHEEEEIDAATGELRFDIDFLAGRMADVTDWALREPATARLRVAYFGASTGAAAALVAASLRPGVVAAVVSRGGRPDLAARALPAVRAPTLLVVGGEDLEVLALNREALDELRCEKRLELVRGATHLFAERGALERVAELAGDWLARHLPAREEEARL